MTSFTLWSWILFLFPAIEGHIGEPCNSLLRVCLPPSPHIFCDSSNICKCKPDFPVEIAPHTCKKVKKVGERCSHDRECSFLDSNSYCNQAPFSSECQCIDGHRFSATEGRCVKSETRVRPRSESFLPSALGFFLASFAIFCCFLFFWHSFCRKPPREWSESSMDRRAANRLTPEVILDAGGFIDPHRLSTTSGQIPSYELALYNQPPPSYEEAIKHDRVINANEMIPSTSSSLPKYSPIDRSRRLSTSNPPT